MAWTQGPVIKFADIHAAWKFGTGGLVVVLAVMTYLSTTFYSRVEAQGWQQAHNQQLALIRVQDVETQIAQYRYQLLSSQLTDAQRNWINSEIRRLEALIACIRAGTC